MPQSDICQVCGAKIAMMVRRGTGICSENCQKKQQGEPVATEPIESEGHHASE